jgi:hypothetical protein
MTKIINPNKARDAKDAYRYQLAQAQKMLDLFENAHGRPANTMEEFEQWLISSEGRAAIADHCNDDGTINHYS